MSGEGAGAATVRACRREDIKSVLEILEGSPEAAIWSEAGLEGALGGGQMCFLVGVARGTGEVAGFVLARRIGNEGEILNLAVKPECRRHGTGNSLLRAALETLKNEAVGRVFLEVRESNGAAIEFYRQRGFERVGKRPGYYQAPDEAAVVMELKLALPGGEDTRKGGVP